MINFIECTVGVLIMIILNIHPMTNNLILLVNAKVELFFQIPHFPLSNLKSSCPSLSPTVSDNRLTCLKNQTYQDYLSACLSVCLFVGIFTFFPLLDSDHSLRQ